MQGTAYASLLLVDALVLAAVVSCAYLAKIAVLPVVKGGSPDAR